MATLAAGARTALISRWRTGGSSTAEFAREFVRDCMGPGEDGASPAESWRRAVELVSPEPLHLENEPRVKVVGNTPIEDASHPFFWAGYMLLDTGSDPAAAEEANPLMQRPGVQMQATPGVPAGAAGQAVVGQAPGAPAGGLAQGPAGVAPATTAGPTPAASAGATPAAAAPAAPPSTTERKPVSQAFNPLLDDPSSGSRE